MDVTKESVREFFNGHTPVGSERAKLTDYTGQLQKGVLLRCPSSADPGGGNTDPVWVGNTGVTADSGPSGGIPILPGDAIFIPIEQASLLWVISTGEDQDIAWMGI